MAERAWWRGLAAGVGIGALVTGVVGSLAVSADGAPTIHVQINGRPVTFASAPLLINNRVYLPVRDVAEAFGLPVTWDGGTDTVEIGTAANGTGGAGFTYQGMRYTADGLQVRSYPGGGNVSGNYWIVSYSMTNTSDAPVDVPQQQPALALFGPQGVQLSPEVSLGGPVAGILNPGITFSSYMVFEVPSGAVPSAYSLGFDTYQIVGGQFTTTPLATPLPVSNATQVATDVSATYSLDHMWNAGLQELTIGRVVQTTEIVPGTAAADFNPATSFWIVDFGVTNPGPEDISFTAGDFALDFNNDLTIGPDSVGPLPGYVTPSGLTASGSVLVPAGQTFSGSLLFVVPASTPTTNPGLALTVAGQTRIISLQPCSSGVCPPVQQ